MENAVREKEARAAVRFDGTVGGIVRRGNIPVARTMAWLALLGLSWQSSIFAVGKATKPWGFGLAGEHCSPSSGTVVKFRNSYKANLR